MDLAGVCYVAILAIAWRHWDGPRQPAEMLVVVAVLVAGLTVSAR
jgi:hypothetical protein